jgi:glycosyltransferase involved in cell wall biosynthesis
LSHKAQRQAATAPRPVAANGNAAVSSSTVDRTQVDAGLHQLRQRNDSLRSQLAAPSSASTTERRPFNLGHFLRWTFSGALSGRHRRSLPVEKLIEACDSGGLDAVQALLETRRTSPSARHRSLLALAKHYQKLNQPGRAASLGRAAYDINAQPALAKWLAFRLFDAGQINEPLALLEGPAAGAMLSESETKRAFEIKALAKLLKQPPTVPAKAGLSYEPIEGALLYVAASCLPYHNSGYTNRTHELNLALKAAGGKVSIVTRPGYPWDRPDRTGLPDHLSSYSEGLDYLHIRTPTLAAPLDEYFTRAAENIARVAKQDRVAAVHAASNYVNALPALLAARRLGLPFVYEMRGLWDLSRASKFGEYENSDRFRLGMQLEALVAKEADRVFVISGALGEYIRKEWGVGPAKIEILPNCVNPETIERAKKAAGPKPDVFTVGYAGSLVEYEGLDLLIDALAELKRNGTIVHARIIGDGPEREKLQEQAKSSRLNGQVQFLGRLSPDEARARLAETHVAVLPRRPDAVCRTIPPLKLAESRGLGLRILAPDLDLLSAELDGCEHSLLFAAGNASSLASQLVFLAENRAESSEHTLPADRFWHHHAEGLLAHARVNANGASGGEMPSRQKGASRGEDFDARLASEGPDALADLALRLDDQEQAFSAAELLLDRGHVSQALAVGDHLVARRETLPVVRRTARLFHRAADVARAANLARRLAVMSSNPGDIRLANEIKQLAQLHRAAAEPPAARTGQPEPRRILNFLAFSLPYRTVGYATRSHGLARGIKNAGWDLVPYTRPGFPLDLASGAPTGEIPAEDTIEGICYHRIAGPARRGRTEAGYLSEAVEACAEAIRRENPAIVHAASNYVTALPALIAARRAGLPFVYEVRGFWEITRTSRDAEFRHTAKFRTMKLFESALTSAADHIITLTLGMRDELVGEGVPADKISIAFNGVDSSLFQPHGRDEKLAAELAIGPGTTVIGYVGSFLDYEGLDDLLAAAAQLKNAGRKFKLLMVGDGAAAPDLRRLAVTLGLEDIVVFTGRVPREEVQAYYSLIDIAPFPRKPWNVCELVSPLKPFEAMALEKLIIAADTKALSESITDGENGLLFRKGDVASLTETLARAFEPDLRQRLCRQARPWAMQHRTWDAAGRICGQVYTQLLTSRQIV